MCSHSCGLTCVLHGASAYGSPRQADAARVVAKRGAYETSLQAAVFASCQGLVPEGPWAMCNGVYALTITVPY